MPGCRLACGDQRRRTGSGSALEALRDNALYKIQIHVYFTCTLLYAYSMRTQQYSHESGSVAPVCKLVRSVGDEPASMSFQPMFTLMCHRISDFRDSDRVQKQNQTGARW